MVPLCSRSTRREGVAGFGGCGGARKQKVVVVVVVGRWCCRGVFWGGGGDQRPLGEAGVVVFCPAPDEESFASSVAKVMRCRCPPVHLSALSRPSCSSHHFLTVVGRSDASQRPAVTAARSSDDDEGGARRMEEEQRAAARRRLPAGSFFILACWLSSCGVESKRRRTTTERRPRDRTTTLTSAAGERGKVRQRGVASGHPSRPGPTLEEHNAGKMRTWRLAVPRSPVDKISASSQEQAYGGAVGFLPKATDKKREEEPLTFTPWCVLQMWVQLFALLRYLLRPVLLF